MLAGGIFAPTARAWLGRRAITAGVWMDIMLGATPWTRLHPTQEVIKWGERGAPASTIIFEPLVDRQQI